MYFIIVPVTVLWLPLVFPLTISTWPFISAESEPSIMLCETYLGRLIIYRCVWHWNVLLCTLLIENGDLFCKWWMYVIRSKVVGIISSMREEWTAILREDQNCHTENVIGNYCWYCEALKISENNYVQKQWNVSVTDQHTCLRCRLMASSASMPPFPLSLGLGRWESPSLSV